MRHLVVLIVLIAVGFIACETDYSYYAPHDPNPDNILTQGGVASVDYTDTVYINKGATFKVTLAVGFPCYSFSSFETEKNGEEYFITPHVIQTEKLCDSTAVKLTRPYDFEPDEPGVFLMHFYQTDEESYNIQVTVVE